MSLSLIVTRSIRSITVAAAALSFAASAAPDDTAKPAALADTGEPAAAATAHSDANVITKYCVLQTPTGTRMTRKVCKTKAEWKREGVDIELEQVLR